MVVTCESLAASKQRIGEERLSGRIATLYLRSRLISDLTNEKFVQRSTEETAQTMFFSSSPETSGPEGLLSLQLGSVD